MNASYTCVKGDCNNGIGTYNFAYGPELHTQVNLKTANPMEKVHLLKTMIFTKGILKKVRRMEMELLQ